MMSSDEKRTLLIEAATALLGAAPHRRLNIVSLNKALFYLDLTSLRDCGATFTRNAYVALDQGPVVAKYAERLLKPLTSEGYAVQTVEGRANPVSLIKFPEFTRLTPRMMEVAEKVARWCSDQSSGDLSRFSHANPGWIIAREEERNAGGIKQIIDMSIAMQQLIDTDPWMNAPFDRTSYAAWMAADSGEGEPW